MTGRTPSQRGPNPHIHRGGGPRGGAECEHEDGHTESRAAQRTSCASWTSLVIQSTQATFLGSFNYPVALLTGFIIVRSEKEFVQKRDSSDMVQWAGFFLLVDLCVMLYFGSLTSPMRHGNYTVVVGGAAALEMNRT